MGDETGASASAVESTPTSRLDRRSMTAQGTIRAGFIGLGDMGAPMARNIIRAGFETTLWARRSASFDAFSALSFRKAASLANLGASSDILGVCVFGDADVIEVVLGEAGILSGMAAGGVILIHATINIETAERIAHAAAQKGVGVLDAPVSGSGKRAADGQLTIMVGGEAEDFAKALPIMRSYGASIQHLGALGSGQKMKVLNNALGSANLRMAYLAIEIAERLGLDREAAMATLRASSGGSFNLEILIDRLLPNPAFARHAITMVQKDVAIFQSILSTAGIKSSRLDEIALESILVLDEIGRSG
jgi:3-hydroxyisobutyrate dehydrogenase-like beta-hydroxyacid dehydrogenase